MRAQPCQSRISYGQQGSATSTSSEPSSASQPLRLQNFLLGFLLDVFEVQKKKKNNKIELSTAVCKDYANRRINDSGINEIVSRKWQMNSNRLQATENKSVVR